MTLPEKVREAGVVGAGGAGFPTHVKLAAQAEWMLGNGAECEPLLHKDRELMTHFAAEVLTGMRLAAKAVGATRCAIGVKSKNAASIQALRDAGTGSDVEISQLGDFYPSGDEYELVYSITGRLIPAAGIPLEIGVVVNNVETLLQIARADRGQPVTETFLTVTGLVREPLTAWVPVGTRINDVLNMAGGTAHHRFAVMESGLMMGRLVKDLDSPITKTTAGLIVLPRDHDLIRRYETPAPDQARIGKSACDQCSYCTELCPRYLLGYDVQPHAVMRSLGFTSTGKEVWNQHALLCCGCGICTLYACPEALFPREACLEGTADLRTAGRGKWTGKREVQAHPMKEFRRVPMPLLIKRLGVEGFDHEASYRDVKSEPPLVRIPLKQHSGDPAIPQVRIGDRARKGQLLGEIPPGRLGARIHASIDGRVTRVEGFVEIERI